ncbi:MAG TPA: ABC transporter family substrate-binding protein [Acidimicrobiales bacterium]|nr:ABC transporter family substrate-binding protein [Acidimicrobiales bacterium]
MLAKGGLVTVAVPSLPTNLNPWTPQGSNQVTAEVAAQIWPSVFSTGPGGEEMPNTAFVTSAEVIGVPPASNFTVQYQINPSAVWSDGTPVTAADFIYLWQQLRAATELPSTVPLAGYDDIASVVGSNGGRTVTVTFTEPDAGWEQLFEELVPSGVAEREGFVAAFSHPSATTALSAGPFALSSFVPGQSLTLVRNPRWWGEPARLDKIVLRVVRGSSAMIRGLQDGAIDLAELGPSAALDDDVAASSDLLALPEESPLLWQLVYNEADPLLAHPSVRQAVSDALDRRELEWDTIGLEDPAVTLAVNHLFPASGGGERAGSYQLPDDAAAYNLLAGDGYTRNGDGLVTTEEGAPLVLHLVAPEGDGLVRRIEALLRAQLLDAGITLVVQNVPLARLLRGVLPAGDYQIALAPYLLSPFAAQNVALYSNPAGSQLPATIPSPGMPMLAPQAALTPAGAEPGAVVSGAVTGDVDGYENRVVTAVATDAFSELNPAKATTLYNRIDAELWNDLPTMPLFQQPVELVMRDDLVDVTYATTSAGPFWDADQWGIQVSPPPSTTTTIP